MVGLAPLAQMRWALTRTKMDPIGVLRFRMRDAILGRPWVLIFLAVVSPLVVLSPALYGRRDCTTVWLPDNECRLAWLAPRRAWGAS